MGANQVVTPSKPLSECRNGWVLMWVKYMNNTSSWNDMVQTYIGKDMVTTSSTSGVRLVFGGYGDVVAHKYLYVTDTQIKGNDNNFEGGNFANRAVLVRIHEF